MMPLAKLLKIEDWLKVEMSADVRACKQDWTLTQEYKEMDVFYHFWQISFDRCAARPSHRDLINFMVHWCGGWKLFFGFGFQNWAEKCFGFVGSI